MKKSTVENTNVSSIRDDAVKGVFWRYLERCAAQGVSFFISIVLARLLSPEIYGTITMVTVFVSILQVFVDSGLGNALIQKKDADELDFSSVFLFNMAVCIFLYIIMFFAAPFISDFYKDAQLTSVIRVLCIIIIISGLKNVQQAYVSRTMQFKKFFYSTFGGTIISAIIGVIMAYLGYGVWSLVFQQLSNTIFDTVILWVTVGWKPKLMFSRKRLAGLLAFGSKLFFASLLTSFYDNVRQLFIGRIYSGNDLALYNRGKQMPQFLVSNINASIDSVLLPTLSKEQEYKNILLKMTRRSIRVSTYLLAPVLIGLVVTSDTLVRMIYTDKWAGSVPYVIIFSMVYLVYPIHTTNLNVINAVGRSDLVFKLEIIKDTFGLLMLFVTAKISVYAIAVGALISGVFSLFVNAWPNKDIIGYSVLMQIKDIIPNFLLASIMGLTVYFVGEIISIYWFRLIMQVFVGIIVYLFISCILHFESYEYVKSIMKNMIINTIPQRYK